MRDVQVTGEVDVTAVPDSQVVAEELKGNDVKEALKRINGLGDAKSSGISGDTLVAFVTQNNGARLASGDLSKGGLNLGVQRILSHDDNDGHVLVDEGEGAMLEFTGKDTL
jgi:hypothetical protein